MAIIETTGDPTPLKLMAHENFGYRLIPTSDVGSTAGLYREGNPLDEKAPPVLIPDSAGGEEALRTMETNRCEAAPLGGVGAQPFGRRT